MKLMSADASPFVRKVRVLAHETGQSDDIELITVKTSPVASDPTALAANPTGKIPALIRENEPALYDSRVICRYLDHRAGAGLYPDARIWDVLTVEATADAICDAAVLVTYEGRLRAPDMVDRHWRESQWSKAARSVEAINTQWMNFLNGPLTMGHIAVGCALGYLDLRHDARHWRNGNDALAAWYEEFAQRPSMVATAPE